MEETDAYKYFNKECVPKSILKEHYITDVKQGNVTLPWRIDNSPRKYRISLAMGWSEYCTDANQQSAF